MVFFWFAREENMKALISDAAMRTIARIKREREDFL
jgi:hypothetical protein